MLTVMTGEIEIWLNALLKQSSPLDFTLFNYAQVDPEWNYENRVLNDHLVYFVTNRSYDTLVNGNLYLTGGPGSLLWIPPGTPHSLRLSKKRDPIRLYHFRFVTERKFSSPFPCFFLKSGWHYQSTIETLFQEYRQSRPMGESRIRALVFLILSGMANEVSLPGAGKGDKGLKREQQKKIHQFAQSSEHIRFTPEELANAAGLETGYFARQFKKTFGISPRAWIVRERVRKIIAEMGESRLSLTELSVKYGYPDLFSFSKQFKKVTGQSPGEYRKRLK